MSEHDNNDQANGSSAAATGSGPSDLKSEDKTMAMLCHLLAIFTGFLGPLIIWLIKKDQSSFVDHHGKEALNFQITIFIAYLVASALTFVLIGCFLLPVIGICALIFSIIAAMAANKGDLYSYPLTIRLVK